MTIDADGFIRDCNGDIVGRRPSTVKPHPILVKLPMGAECPFEPVLIFEIESDIGI